LNLVRLWWDWSSESFGHMFLGVTLPILLFGAVFVIFFAGSRGGSGTPPLPPQSDIAGVCVTGTPDTESAQCHVTPLSGLLVETATPVPPTPTPKPITYTVQAGDTLSQICAARAPSMATDQCVESIVELNGLDGPSEIFVGQSLQLPAGASSKTTSTTASSTTRSATPVPSDAVPEPTTVVEAEPTDTPAPEPTATPEPTEEAAPQASLTAIGPAAQDTPQSEATPVNASAVKGTEYVVQPGDSLLGICVAEVTDMGAEDCVDYTTLLNDLAGPDEIQVGQVLVLP
jgi:nucleoid-associated protein YgaU